MASAPRIFIEQAASICFNRASMWKEREQYARSVGQDGLATQYRDFCSEADECKLFIRTAFIVPSDGELVSQIIDLAKMLPPQVPVYAELNNFLEMVQKQISRGMIPQK